jgi:hypothetical protein
VIIGQYDNFRDSQFTNTAITASKDYYTAIRDSKDYSPLVGHAPGFPGVQTAVDFKRYSEPAESQILGNMVDVATESPPSWNPFRSKGRTSVHKTFTSSDREVHGTLAMQQGDRERRARAQGKDEGDAGRSKQDRHDRKGGSRDEQDRGKRKRNWLPFKV